MIEDDPIKLPGDEPARIVIVGDRLGKVYVGDRDATEDCVSITLYPGGRYSAFLYDRPREFVEGIGVKGRDVRGYYTIHEANP